MFCRDGMLSRQANRDVVYYFLKREDFLGLKLLCSAYFNGLPASKLLELKVPSCGFSPKSGRRLMRRMNLELISMEVSAQIYAEKEKPTDQTVHKLELQFL